MEVFDIYVLNVDTPHIAFVEVEEMDLIRHKWVEAGDRRLCERMDANFHVFSPVERGSWLSLQELAPRIEEGERLYAMESERRGYFRPSSIQDLRLDERGLASFDMAGEFRVVGVGDVVMSKFLPPRAAWVTASTARRPIDQNCVRLIGLEQEYGFWVANVLEHPYYQGLLAKRSASSMIPRLGLRDLRSLRVPETPVEARALAERWSHAEEELSVAEGRLVSLQEEVEEYVKAETPLFPDLQPQFYPTASFPDVWTPGYARLKRFQAQVRAQGWVRLEDFLSEDFARMRERVAESVRVLHLRNADGMFGFHTPEPHEFRQMVFRLFKKPLQAGEVLLSVLGTSPKVVFHHPVSPLSSEIFLSDQWVRLEPSATSGALALLLNAPPISQQLGSATTGSIQQFVPKSEFEQLCIPNVPAFLATEWDQRLRELLESVNHSQKQLDDILVETRQLVSACIGGSYDT